MFSRELQIAIEASRAAAAEIKLRYGTNPEVRYKTPIEPVTDADMVADEVLHNRLCDAFPNDGWLSEERADDATRLNCERVWIVDPLDGTREFVAGRPEFMVSVGLCVDGVPVVGVLTNPVTGDIFSAVVGQGATRNGKRIHVSKAVTPSQVAVSRSELGRGQLTAFGAELPLEAAGGMANKLALVGAGVADATFTTWPRCEWDVAAGILLVQEAGGRTTRLDGGPITFNCADTRFQGILSSNGILHDALLETVNRLTTG